MKLPFNARFLVLGLLVYVVALVLNFPAERAYAHWQSSESAMRHFSLAGISGSVWSGKADMAMIQGNQLENIEWSLRPWSLLLGKVGVNWRLQVPDAQNKGVQGEGFGQGVTSLGLDGSIDFSSLEARLPAAMAATMARIGVLQPAGSVSLNLQDVKWDGQSLVSAEGRIAWHGAGVRLLKPLSLGDLSLVLETANNEIKGVIADSGGPLSAEGLITLTRDGRYQFNGAFAARGDTSGDKSLEHALRSMGRPGPDGKVKVSYSGSLARLGLVPGQRKK